jgi:hypothetical protein
MHPDRAPVPRRPAHPDKVLAQRVDVEDAVEVRRLLRQVLSCAEKTDILISRVTG